jgi:hypothetical protein
MGQRIGGKRAQNSKKHAKRKEGGKYSGEEKITQAATAKKQSAFDDDREWERRGASFFQWGASWRRRERVRSAGAVDFTPILSPPPHISEIASTRIREGKKNNSCALRGPQSKQMACCCLSTRSSIWPIDVHQIYCSKDLAAGKTEFASRELIDWQKRKMINREIQAASD